MSVLFFKLIPRLCNTQMGLDLPRRSVPTLHLCVYPACPTRSPFLCIGLPRLTRWPPLRVTHDRTRWFVMCGSVQGCQDRTKHSSSNRPRSQVKELPFIEAHRGSHHLLVPFDTEDTAVYFNCQPLEGWQSSNTSWYLTVIDQYNHSLLLLAQIQRHCYLLKNGIPQWEGLVTVGVSYGKVLMRFGPKCPP